VPDYQAAFAAIFGQGMWIIVGSLVAFLVGQLIDVQVFHRIRARTGERHAWLRATGSTAVSQLVDNTTNAHARARVTGPTIALKSNAVYSSLNTLDSSACAIRESECRSSHPRSEVLAK